MSIKEIQLKAAVNYTEPNKKICKDCRFFKYLPGLNVLRTNSIKTPCCMYLYGLEISNPSSWRFTIDASFIFEVNPFGSCNCFKKRLERCPFYNESICKRRKCDKKEYDDNCMEIDEC